MEVVPASHSRYSGGAWMGAYGHRTGRHSFVEWYDGVEISSGDL